MENATVEALVNAVENRLSVRGYEASFVKYKKNNGVSVRGIQIKKKGTDTGVMVHIDECIAGIETGTLNISKAAEDIEKWFMYEMAGNKPLEMEKFAELVKKQRIHPGECALFACQPGME